MSSSPFLPLPPGLEIRTTTTVDDLLRVEVASTRSSSSSPLCLHPAMRIHSRYRRVVADVPCPALGAHDDPALSNASSAWVGNQWRTGHTTGRPSGHVHLPNHAAAARDGSAHCPTRTRLHPWH